MDRGQIKVSVIVPVYNAENYIDQCLLSLAGQTYKEFELILVDDGSTDQSGKICDKYTCMFQNITVIHKKNEGSNAARTEGLYKAVGQYISFIDADDWVDKDFLDLLVASMESCQADIVAAGCVKEKENVCEREKNHFKDGIYERDNIIKNIIPKMLHFRGFYEFGILPYLCNKLFKRDLLLKCFNDIDTGIYDGEDVAIVYPYILQTNKMVISNDEKYHYRIHNSSVTSGKRQDYYANVAKLYLYLYDKFTKSEFTECMLKQLDQYMRRMIWNGNPENFIEADQNVFPFDKVPQGASIVLYAAGNMGRRYYLQIKKTGYCKLSAWVDRRWKMDELRALGVESPDVIKEKEFNYIVIAVDNVEISKEIRNSLIQNGIENAKII